MTSSRTSHSLSRRSAVQQSLRRPVRESLVQGALSPEVEALSQAASDASPTQSAHNAGMSSQLSTRKSRLVSKLTERDEAERKDREREQRKALLKEKRHTTAALVQARHGASEQSSKVKRGADEILKVGMEIERLEKWRLGQIDRLQMLMKQLVEEQEQVEAEFVLKHSEAAAFVGTLELEQTHLESDVRMKDEEVSTVERHLQNIVDDLKRLDDGAGVTWNGGWKSLLGYPDSMMSRGITDDAVSVSSFGGEHSTAALQKKGENAKAGSPARSVPLPIAAGRSTKSTDAAAQSSATQSTATSLLGSATRSSATQSTVVRQAQDQAANKGRGAVGATDIAEMQRAQTPQRYSPPLRSATASNIVQIATNADAKAMPSGSNVARNLVAGVSPLRSLSPPRSLSPGQVERPQQMFVPGSATSTALSSVNYGSSATSSARVPSTGPAPVRIASQAVSGYPGVARQMPQVQPSPFGQVAQMPIRSATPQRSMPMASTPLAPAPSNGLSSWDM